MAPGWTPGTARTVLRCVRPTYRLGLVRPGDPCVLWRSGRDRPGIAATGVVAAEPAEAEGGPVVAVLLTLLVDPVPRAELLADPRFRDAEVLRMPAGSNPSWLSAVQHTAVLDRLRDPGATTGRAGAPGTMGPCVATGSGGEPSAGS